MSMNYCQQCPNVGCSQDTVELCVKCWDEIIKTKSIPLWISKWVYEMKGEYKAMRKQVKVKSK